MTSLVTDTGLAAIVSALVADDTVKYVGWGTGSGATVASTDLVTPSVESRTTGVATSQTTTTAGDTYRVIGSIVSLGAQDITEVGVFSAATGAVMDVYGDFTAVTLATNDVISFTIDVVLDQV